VLRSRALALGPVQQAVRVEGVVHPAATARMKLKTHLGPTGGNGLANLRLLLGGGAIFFGQVFAQVLPAGGHVRVQLKGLEMQIGLHLAVQALQGFFQSTQAHGAPGAGNVRNEIDFQCGDHDGLSARLHCPPDNICPPLTPHKSPALTGATNQAPRISSKAALNVCAASYCTQCPAPATVCH